MHFTCNVKKTYKHKQGVFMVTWLGDKNKFLENNRPCCEDGLVSTGSLQSRNTESVWHVPHLLPSVNSDRLQPPCDPAKDERR